MGHILKNPYVIFVLTFVIMYFVFYFLGIGTYVQVTEDGPTGEVGDLRMAFTTDGTSGGRAAFAYYPSSTQKTERKL